jgi:hypothetical protein
MCKPLGQEVVVLLGVNVDQVTVPGVAKHHGLFVAHLHVQVEGVAGVLVRHFVHVTPEMDEHVTAFQKSTSHIISLELDVLENCVFMVSEPRGTL